MKKLYFLAIALMATCSVFAQSQRTVLSEEFTQASCGPCAAQNPAFNALLGANTAKVVVLKYQTSWPGVDPMNAQTQNQGVLTRVNYYGISGVPTGILDGRQQIGASYTGAPANWTQTAIDTRYAESSPFTLNTSHVYNATYDSVTITVQLTCTQAVTTGSLTLLVDMIEKEVDFCSAPGTNGETVFYGVTRKMLPNGVGSTISNTWTVGQTQTWVFTAAVPSYVYDKKTLAVVAFVQDNSTFTETGSVVSGATTLTLANANTAIVPGTYISGTGLPNGTVVEAVSGTTLTISNAATASSTAATYTLAQKEVLQTGISEPLPIPLDAGIKVCGATNLVCNLNYTPTITVNNYGTSPITTFDCNYKLNTGTLTPFTWNGTLAPGATTTFTLPVQTLNAGTNTFTCTLAAVNGVAHDYVTTNDAYTTTVVTNVAPGTNPPVVQGFTTSTFPPTNWFRINGGSTYTWSRLGAGATGTNGSAKMDFWTAAPGDLDDLITEKVDLSTALSADLNFKSAKAGYGGAYIDTLRILVSSDCGANWTNIWEQNDPQLATAGNLTSGAYTVTANAAAWTAQTASLNAFIGQPEVLVMFRAASGNGNNLFIDDINITSTVGLAENAANQQINVYPSPTNGQVTVDLSAVKTTATITVTDESGKVISVHDNIKNTNALKLDISGQQDGVYYIQIDTNSQRIIKKVVLNK